MDLFLTSVYKLRKGAHLLPVDALEGLTKPYFEGL